MSPWRHRLWCLAAVCLVLLTPRALAALEARVASGPGFYGLVVSGCAGANLTVLRANSTALSELVIGSLGAADDAAAAAEIGLMVQTLPRAQLATSSAGDASVPSCLPSGASSSGGSTPLCLQPQRPYTFACGGSAEPLVAVLPAFAGFTATQLIGLPRSNSSVYFAWTNPASALNGTSPLNRTLVRVSGSAVAGSASRWGLGHQFHDYPVSVASFELPPTQTSLVVSNLPAYSIFKADITSQGLLVQGSVPVFAFTMEAQPAALTAAPRALSILKDAITLHWTEPDSTVSGRLVSVLVQWRPRNATSASLQNRTFPPAQFLVLPDQTTAVG